MKRSRFTHHKPSETEEKVVMEYKGRYYEVPRSEYHRRLTHIDKTQRSKQIQAVSQIRSDVASTSNGPRSKNNDTMVTNFFDQLQQSFKNTMEKTSPAVETPPKESGTSLENYFTLEDCNESQQTIVERKIERKESLPQSNHPIPEESTPQLQSQSQGSGQLVTDTLEQLKSNVTNLIDRTIQEIESKASLSQNVSQETILMKRSLGGGNSVKNSDSYVQSKRNKLYEEIEVILKRLQDMEFLE